MIRAACLLLLLAAHALAAPATLPQDLTSDLPQDLHRALLAYQDEPKELLDRTTWKSRRNAPAEVPDTDGVNRKQFIVKSVCRMGDKKCAYAQVYEFDLLRVEPSAGGNGVYY